MRDRKEGTAIAKLLNSDSEMVAWAILWDNNELSVLWLDENQTATRIDPPLSSITLANAKAVRADKTLTLLEALSAGCQ